MSTQGYIDFIVRGKSGDIDISPTHIEIGLLKSFADDVTAIINSIPEIEKNKVIVAVGEGSFKLTAMTALIAVNSLIVDAKTLTETNDLFSINSTRSKVIEKWYKKAKANPEIEFEIRPNGNEGIKINSDKTFKKEDNVWVQSELYLYGEFKDMGGNSKPNIHFLTDNNLSILINCKEEHIKNEKVNRVYHHGGVRITALQNLYTGEIKDAYFIDFIDYNPEYNESELATTIEKGREAWKDIPDHIEWVRNLRNDE